MKDVHKYLIFSIAAVLAFTIFVVGTFLPYRKSGLYIDALTLSRSARSFSEFMEPYQRALDAASPVGQRELIRNFASTVRSVVERSGEQDSRIAHAALNILDSYSTDLLEDSSVADTQLLLTVGSAYMQGYRTTGDASYQERALILFNKGRHLAPQRPQFLYALFEGTLLERDEEKVRTYGEEILSLWPDDERVLEVLDIL